MSGFHVPAPRLRFAVPLDLSELFRIAMLAYRDSVAACTPPKGEPNGKSFAQQADFFDSLIVFLTQRLRHHQVKVKAVRS